jgi:hypothetical protein
MLVETSPSRILGKTTKMSILTRIFVWAYRIAFMQKKDTDPYGDLPESTDETTPYRKE